MLGNQKIIMRLRSYDHRILYKSASDIVEIAKRTGATVRGPIPLPTKKIKFTLLRSPHIDKKARDQLEIRKHTVLFYVSCLPETGDALSNLQISSDVEVEIKV